MHKRGSAILASILTLIFCSIYGSDTEVGDDELSHTRFCLSVDGGGVRGIIPAAILKEIETRTSKSIHHLFQSGLTGTSTGGLIALGLGARKSLDSTDAQYNAPLFTAEELVRFYYDESKDIFPTEEASCCCSCWVSFLNCVCCRGVFSSEYDNEYLVKRLKKIFGTRKLKDSLIPVQVVAFDLNRNAPVYFSSLTTPDVLMVDAALATTAAPTFFPAHSFRSGTVDYQCIDGGVFENNPVAPALKQAITFYHQAYSSLTEYHDFKVVSIGTGHIQRSLDVAGLSRAGKIKWASEVVEIAITGTSIAADKHMRHFFISRGVRDNYFRLQVPIAESDSKLDDSRESNLRKLRAAVDNFVSDDDRGFLLLIDKLNAPRTYSEQRRGLVMENDLVDLEIDDSEGTMYSAQGEVDETEERS